MEQLRHLQSVAQCHCCSAPFLDESQSVSPTNDSDSTSTTTTFTAEESHIQASMKLPSRGKHCDHTLCKACIYTHYFENAFKTRHSFIHCPICQSQRSFSKRPIVDHDLVKALKGSQPYRDSLADLHQAPWKIPVGAFAHVLELVGKDGDDNAHVAFKSDLVHDVLQGLVQVHNFQNHNHRH